MCTLLTVDRDTFDISESVYLDRIASDWAFNSDGLSCILTDTDGAVVLNLRTFDISLLGMILRSSVWSRMFLHQRMSTGGEIDEANIHGWNYRGVYVMHNGVLHDPRADRLPVDSMLIGRWIIEGGLTGALDMLTFERFANVFLLAPRDGIYCVARSVHGGLHSDGLGNYSTVCVAGIDRPVLPGSYAHTLDGILISEIAA